jgi:outer membrane murein-binding lipoprotein Lpp
MLVSFIAFFVVAFLSFGLGYLTGSAFGARCAEMDNTFLSSELNRTRDEKEAMRSKLYAAEADLVEANARVSMLRMGHGE